MREPQSTEQTFHSKLVDNMNRLVSHVGMSLDEKLEIIRKADLENSSRISDLEFRRDQLSNSQHNVQLTRIINMRERAGRYLQMVSRQLQARKGLPESNLSNSSAPKRTVAQLSDRRHSVSSGNLKPSDDRPLILVFLSEILSAKSIVPILRALQSEAKYALEIVNDGFCMDFVKTLGLPTQYLLHDFEQEVDHIIKRASVILMGKSYVQPSEYILLRRAALWNVPVLMVLPDMGFDIVKAKLSGIGEGSEGSAPWPTLLLGDDRTASELKILGAPKENIEAIGNPYFDELYADLENDDSQWDGVGVGYFSTPFELDFERGILPAKYRQVHLIADIQQAASALQQPVLAKRHPQVDEHLFADLDVFDGSPLEMIRKIRIAVGSYSTTLLEAFAAGIPTISYQPWERAIRADVFRGRIPITRNIADLVEEIKRSLRKPKRGKVQFVTANVGQSLTRAMKHIDALANRKLRLSHV